MQNDSIDERIEEEDNDTVAAVYINSDLIFLILTLLSVRTLLRFRSVCKSWYDLISDRRFVNAHIEISRRNPKVVVSSFAHHGRRGDMLLKFYEEGKSRPDLLFTKRLTSHIIQTPMRPVHCDGILLLETPDETFVFNPSTRETTTLPGNQHLLNGFMITWDNARIGFVSGANVYKVTRFYSHDFNSEGIRASAMGLEVFTLGVDSSWRVKAMDPPNQIYTRIDSPVSAGGAIYYKIHYESMSCPNFQLFRFDLTREEFTVIPRPHSVKNIMGYSVLRELEGTLCLFLHGSTKNFDVWKLLKDSTGYTWIPGFSIYLPSLPMPFFFNPVQMERGKLLLQIGNSLVFYDFGTKSIDNAFSTAQDFARHGSFHVVSYVESLVSFRGTRPVSN